MSVWLVVWFVVGLTTTALLIAFIVALVRHGLVVGRTAARMAEEVGPITAEIQRAAADGSAHAARLRAPGRPRPQR